MLGSLMARLNMVKLDVETAAALIEDFDKTEWTEARRGELRQHVSSMMEAPLTRTAYANFTQSLSN